MNTKTNRRNWLRSLAVVGTGLSLAGCGGSGDGGGEDTPTDTPTPTATPSGGGDGTEWVETSTVDMTDELTFDPENIQVAAGTTITWENVGAVGHTVTAYDDGIPEGATYFASGGFDNEEAARDGYPDEGNITEGESYEHTFETVGTYEYFCIPHELNGMVGKVKVN